MVLAERHSPVAFQLCAAQDDAALTNAMRETLGLALPAAPGSATGSNGARALWLGPGRWQVSSATEPAAEFEDRLRQGLRGTSGHLLDVSHARAVIRMSGPQVREVLAKGCPLDFDVDAFPPGGCCSSTLGGIGALIHHTEDAASWDVSVGRSFGPSFWEWLTDAAAEFGYRVEEPRGGAVGASTSR